MSPCLRLKSDIISNLKYGTKQEQFRKNLSQGINKKADFYWFLAPYYLISLYKAYHELSKTPGSLNTDRMIQQTKLPIAGQYTMNNR